jgi:hypothetical protein
MTATEIQMRMKEYIRRATPLFEPMDLDYNGKLCQATFDLMERIGAFGSVWERPAPMRGERIAFKFQNPLVQAEAEAKTGAFEKAAQLFGMALQLDPSLRGHFNIKRAFRASLEGTGAPADWSVDEREADAIAAQDQARAAAAQQAAVLGNVGEQAGKIALAAKNVRRGAKTIRADVRVGRVGLSAAEIGCQTSHT